MHHRYQLRASFWNSTSFNWPIETPVRAQEIEPALRSDSRGVAGLHQMTDRPVKLVG